MKRRVFMVQLISGYSHSHQLDFELDWSWIKLWLAQIVLTFLTGEMEKNSSSACLSLIGTTRITTTTVDWKRRWWVFLPCTAASASSGGVCAWGGAETPPLAGSQAAGGAGGVLSLQRGCGGGEKSQDSPWTPWTQQLWGLSASLTLRQTDGPGVTILRQGLHFIEGLGRLDGDLLLVLALLQAETSCKKTISNLVHMAVQTLMPW